ncbi:MAG: IS66 family transposase [Chloroflexota bacterium]|nr:IS66 family transposase [Chloroflexota bacterium]
MIDLKNASRDDLIRLVIAQHETIAQQERTIADLRGVIATLEATVARLTAQVGKLLATVETLQRGDEGAGSGRPQGMPGLKPATGKARPPKQVRKRREQQFVRHRMEPTQRVIHAVEHCPTCGVTLMGGSVKRRREVIEVPVVSAVVTEHLFLERCCPHCRTRHTPAVALTGDAVGRQRFGVGLVSLIATMREEGRLPIATIQWYLATFHWLHISRGAIVGAIQQVARRSTAVVAGIQQEIRGSPVAHLDETGWRENGVNGYVWTCSTPGARYFARGSREGKMVAALLGDDFAGGCPLGGMVSDFYAGYQHYPGVKQKCWAHLLRDVHDLRVAHAEDADVQAWAAAVHDCYVRAVAWKRLHADDGEAARQQAEGMFMGELQAISAPYREVPVPQRVLSQRMAKHLHELFVFVREPAVPPDNNAAERALRHLVTSRNAAQGAPGGGTRSPAGSETKMTLASLFAGALWAGWRVRGINPFTACRALLISPHP